MRIFLTKGKNSSHDPSLELFASMLLHCLCKILHQILDVLNAHADAQQVLGHACMFTGFRRGMGINR